jgi:hypothetical protein
MSNNLRTRNGLPFNFVDGLKVKGVDVSNITNLIETAITAHEESVNPHPEYQQELQPGVNIKTINGASLLGAGNLQIQDGGAVEIGVASFNTRTGPVTLTSIDVTSALGFTPENVLNRNSANGYAGLDSTGKIATSQLPSYVDDVIEASSFSNLPVTGESGKIYITIDNGKTYRWGGSSYAEISAAPGSTDSVAEGSVNLYYTQARVRASVNASGSLSYNPLTGVFSYTQPSNVSAFTNDSGYLTAVAAAVTYAPINTTVTIAGAQTLQNKTVEALSLTNGYTEEVFAVTGTTPTLEPKNGSIQTWALTASSTPTSGSWSEGQSITLLVDDGSSRTINWASLSVTWKTDSGSAPTLNTTGYTVIVLWKVGSTIFGARVGNA